jgi:dolichyl-phosphate-mannose-protein mannosyltransferase
LRFKTFIFFKFIMFDHSLLQYSQYNNPEGVNLAKPVSPVLSTIGGEQGGRAPIVIKDKNVQVAAAPENAATMADPGKAEPGRDIFAGEPVKEIKSDHLPVQPPDPVREQKEISSVIVGTLLSSTAFSTSDSTSSNSESNSEPSSTASVETTATEGDSAKPQAAGPLGEEELEAQKVANELYPDAT